MMDDCRLCGVQHDDQVHAAVLRIHSWLRTRMSLVMTPTSTTKKRDVMPGLPGVCDLKLPPQQRARASRLGGRGQRGVK